MTYLCHRQGTRGACSQQRPVKRVLRIPTTPRSTVICPDLDRDLPSWPTPVLRQALARREDHDPNLDILRSIAVLSVFLAHALQVVAGCKPHEYLAYGIDTSSLGRIGVLIFFVHTSLVLLRSLERTGANLSGWSLIRYFYVRRAFRIYPLSSCLIL